MVRQVNLPVKLSCTGVLRSAHSCPLSTNGANNQPVDFDGVNGAASAVFDVKVDFVEAGVNVGESTLSFRLRLNVGKF